jgi:beta-lactamase class D
LGSCHRACPHAIPARVDVQDTARAIGEQQERRYLQSIGYGNADPSGGIDRFWLDGNLHISAEEQVAFLRRLHRNELPFRAEHQRLVKDVMIVEARREWILRAKDLPKREGVAREVLRSIGALPTDD